MKKYLAWHIKTALILGSLLVLERSYTEPKENKFTQTEAHLSLGKIRKLIENRYANLKKAGDTTVVGILKYDEKPLEMYLDLIASVLAKEGELKKTHYAFYHAQTIEWRVLQDLYRKLYEKFSLKGGKLTNFEFLRFEQSEYAKTPTEFLQEQTKGDEGYDLINDNDNEKKLFLLLLSANLALFGNISFQGECTWEYFINNTTRKTPGKEHIENILNTFGATHDYIDDIMGLNDLLQLTPEQQLFQIFIPKNLVDTLAYLSFLEGIPADKDTLEWVRSKLPKKLLKAYNPYKKVFNDLRDIIHKEGDKNKLFANLIERIDNEDFSVDALLDTYCNTPNIIKNINYLQARLLFTKNILLNPFVGIKMFRYTRLSKKQETAYQEKLGEIMDKIVQKDQTTSSIPENLEQEQ